MLRGSDTDIPRRLVTAIWLTNQRDPFISLGPARGDLGSVVGRAIVHDHRLPRLRSLAADAGEGFVQRIDSIVGGNDDGRRAHEGSFPTRTPQALRRP